MYTKTISLFYTSDLSFHLIEQSSTIKNFVLQATYFFTHVEHSQTMVKFDLLLLWIEQSIPRQKVCSTLFYLIEQSSPCQKFVLHRFT